MDVLRADSLASLPWLVHGFSTRTGGFSKTYGGGTLNLGFTAQDSEAARLGPSSLYARFTPTLSTASREFQKSLCPATAW